MMALDQQWAMLHDPDNLRNLSYYVELPEAPAPGEPGFGEAVHLLNKAVVLLLRDDPRWRHLAAKGARWLLAEEAETENLHPFRQWGLLEWAWRSRWLLAEPNPVAAAQLYRCFEECIPELDPIHLAEQSLPFLALGATELAAQVIEAARAVGPLPLPGRRLDPVGACQAALAVQQGDEAPAAGLRRYLERLVRSEMAAHQFAGALPWAALYHQLFARDQSPAETLRNLALDQGRAQ